MKVSHPHVIGNFFKLLNLAGSPDDDAEKWFVGLRQAAPQAKIQMRERVARRHVILQKSSETEKVSDFLDASFTAYCTLSWDSNPGLERRHITKFEINLVGQKRRKGEGGRVEREQRV